MAFAGLRPSTIDHDRPTMKRMTASHVLAVLVITAIGCAGFHPRPMEEVPFIERE